MYFIRFNKHNLNLNLNLSRHVLKLTTMTIICTCIFSMTIFFTNLPLYCQLDNKMTQ
jgi:hypothetical protein